MRLAGLALIALLLQAPTASALSCQAWNRMGPAQKDQTISRMVDDAIRGSGGRSYQVNRGAVRRCMDRYRRDMHYAFDDACADSRTAGMRALDNIFRKYIWHCVG